MLDLALLQLALNDDLENPEGMLTSDMSIGAASKLWLARSFFKKFEEAAGREADDRCLRLFVESNRRCLDFVFRPQNTVEDLVIGEVRTLLDDVFFAGPDTLLDFPAVAEGFGVGPGASIGARADNFFTKLFDSDLTSTSMLLYDLYDRSVARDPLWSRAEAARHQKHGRRVVVGSRLSFVPKTSEVSRSICTEPNLNMFFQKGVGAFLERRLRQRFSINLDTQPELNRRLAMFGSVDGGYATLDLSSASDSIGLKMLAKVLPPVALRWLDLARSPRVVFPDGSLNELYMVSSMGNAFTFPLMTMLFAAIVTACYRVKGITPTRDRIGPVNWAVFGDDIIVRKDCYEFVRRCLELFGFTVNEDKSFNTGQFRESCGGDYFKGSDIRGVYLRRLATSADVYSAINRLTRWSAKTGVMLPRTVKMLVESLDPKRILWIPPHDGDAEGIKVFRPVGFTRMDKHTQGFCYLALVKRSYSFAVPESAEAKRYYPAKHRKNKVPSGRRARGEDFPSQVSDDREVTFNPDGILISMLQGAVRNGRISVRSPTDRFKVRHRVTSSWGNTGAAWHEARDYGWEAVVILYFDLKYSIWC